MKKTIIAVTVAAMLLATAAPVYAGTATYKATQDFIDALEAANWKYTLGGIMRNGSENVDVLFEGDYMPEILINCFFSDDNSDAIFYSWNVINFTRADVEDVIVLCNELNLSLPYVKFYIDTDDNSGTAELSYLMDEDLDCGYISLKNMYSMVCLVDEAYKVLQPYNATGTSHGSLGDLLYGQ